MISEKDDYGRFLLCFKVRNQVLDGAVRQPDQGQVCRKQLGIRAFYRDIGRKVVVIRPVAVGGMVLHRHVE